MCWPTISPPKGRRRLVCVTGTDEHGTKNKRAAEDAGKTPKQYVDEISQLFRDLAPALNVATDQFVRSTDPAHEKVAQALWKACAKDIYKAKYEGWYCVGCETFYTETELPTTTSAQSTRLLSKRLPKKTAVQALSLYTDQIKELVSTDKLRIYPLARKNEIMALLEQGLEDISISRDKKQLTWGIPVPGDSSQVMYVWFGMR